MGAVEAIPSMGGEGLRINSQRRRARQVLGWTGILVTAAAALAPDLGAQQAAVRSATEDQLRTAFLFQVAQYVSWTQVKPGDPIRFCVMGDDLLAFNLESAVRGKVIQGRVVSSSRIANPEQITGCQIAYLGVSRRRIQEILSAWRYPPVLLVGDSDGFAKQGGMVNIRIDSGRLAMEINLQNCRKAGLDVRSQLLRLARIVPADGDTP